ncbi:Malate dehydrogenase, cytoplasmic [Galdieria sulphuraria]|nr:Malate dehydrogenase, cytoplasmic [Galdieria sulphuraria]
MRVTVTGAAGQIAYCLLPFLARGDVFGTDQPIELVLLDIEEAQTSLRGVVMELEDGAYPLVSVIHCTSNVSEAFVDCDVAVLLGAFPRKLGMERRDLLLQNAAIFKEQGEAIHKYAKRSVRVLVVGNPANTNAAVLAHFASAIDKKQITALSRLDQNRATSFIANELKVSPSVVKNVFVWGNHSNTQYPDLFHAVTNRGPLPDWLRDENFLREKFIPIIQERGAAVIKARKLSSAMSAANAVADHLRDWFAGTQDVVNMVVCSDGSYGIRKGIFFSFPCYCYGNGTFEIVPHFPWDAFGDPYIQRTKQELYKEWDQAFATLLPKSSL